MRAIKNQNGYTIVETMIVLAVTGVMLTATILLVSGQIARYQFKDSVYNIQQQIQGVLNDVQTGYFAQIENANSAAPTIGSCNDINPANTGDSDCVYAGKKITIDSNGLMTLTPLAIRAADAKTKPSNANTDLVELINYKQEVQLPGYVDYLDDAEVYVLFTFYPTSGGNDSGGAQATETLYKLGSNLLVSSGTNPGSVFCIENGSRQAKFIIGVGGANIVEVKYESC